MHKLKALASQMSLLNHELETQAELLLGQIEERRAKAAPVFAKAHTKVEEFGQHLSDVDQCIDELDRATNGPPSSASSGESAAPARNGPDINGVTVHKQG